MKPTRHVYHSDVTGGGRELYVYTPPGYDRAQTYPLLYLVGGSGELPSNWIYDGRASFILDNLIAEKKAVPMVMVVPNNQVVHGNHPQPRRNEARPGPVPSADTLEVFDAYFAWRRSPEGDAWAK